MMAGWYRPDRITGPAECSGRRVNQREHRKERRTGCAETIYRNSSGPSFSVDRWMASDWPRADLAVTFDHADDSQRSRRAADGDSRTVTSQSAQRGSPRRYGSGVAVVRETSAHLTASGLRRRGRPGSLHLPLACSRGRAIDSGHEVRRRCSGGEGVRWPRRFAFRPVTGAIPSLTFTRKTGLRMKGQCRDTQHEQRFAARQW